MALPKKEFATYDSRTEKQYLERKRFWLNHTRDLYEIMVNGAVERWKQNQETIYEARAKNISVANIKGLNESLGEIYNRLHDYFKKGEYLDYQNLIVRTYDDFFLDAIDKMKLGHKPNDAEKSLAKEFAVGMLALVKQMTDIDVKNASTTKEKTSP